MNLQIICELWKEVIFQVTVFHEKKNVKEVLEINLHGFVFMQNFPLYFSSWLHKILHFGIKHCNFLEAAWIQAIK